MSEWLLPTELVDLTGYKQKRKQLKALVELNIPFRLRPKDRFPLVHRSHFATEKTRRQEPNFSQARA